MSTPSKGSTGVLPSLESIRIATGIDMISAAISIMAGILVIILILFTLALSIALRPRHRETPVQLSTNAHTALAIA